MLTLHSYLPETKVLITSLLVSALENQALSPPACVRPPPKVQASSGGPRGVETMNTQGTSGSGEEQILGDPGHTSHCPSGRSRGARVPQQRQVETHLFLTSWLADGSIGFC